MPGAATSGRLRERSAQAEPGGRPVPPMPRSCPPLGPPAASSYLGPMRLSSTASLLSLLFAALASAPSAHAETPGPTAPLAPLAPLPAVQEAQARPFVSLPAFVAGWAMVGAGAIDLGIAIGLMTSPPGSPGTSATPSRRFGEVLLVSGFSLVSFGGSLAYVFGHRRAPAAPPASVASAAPSVMMGPTGGALLWSF